MRLRKGRPWRELVGVAARGRWMDGDGSLVEGWSSLKRVDAGEGLLLLFNDCVEEGCLS